MREFRTILRVLDLRRYKSLRLKRSRIHLHREQDLSEQQLEKLEIRSSLDFVRINYNLTLIIDVLLLIIFVCISLSTAGGML